MRCPSVFKGLSPWLWLLVAPLLLSTILSATSQAQDEGRRPSERREMWRNRGPWGGRMAPGMPSDPGSMRFGNGPRDLISRPIERGYVFLDGEYLPPPYVIEQDGEVLKVNDRLVPMPELSEDTDENRPRRRMVQGRWPPSYPELVHRLEIGDLIVLFDDGQFDVVPRAVGGISLLNFLSTRQSTEGNTRSIETLLDQLPPDILRSSWADWLESYVSPPELIKRTRADLREYEKIRKANNASVTGRRQFDSLSYPLTVLGMVLAVVALGHLISCRPDALDPLVPEEPTAGMSVRVARTITLMIMLSGLDLAWTILAWQGNQMRELNPLGSHLIEDTNSLILFKGSATIFSAGLLFALHRHRSARIAAWWLCLLCTVLAFRWLTFNSMFVS